MSKTLLKLHAYAVDVSGGVESAKGIKDQQLIEKFMQGVQRGSAKRSVRFDYTQYPDARGHFGIHGGRFVSETLMAALEDLESLYNRMKNDEQFWQNSTVISPTMLVVLVHYIMLSDGRNIGWCANLLKT
jgi:hypothetical protein